MLWRVLSCLVVVSVSCKGGAPALPQCEVDLSGYRQQTFSKPDATPVPFVPFELSAGSGIQVTFAPEAHSNGGLTYWLAGDEDLLITVQLAIGAGETDWYGKPLFGLVLVDGVQRPFAVDGGPADVISHHVVPTMMGTLRFQLRVDHGDIPKGAHNVALLFLHEKGPKFQTWLLTAIRDDYPFPAWEASSVGTTIRGKAGLSVSVPGQVGFLRGKQVPDDSGQLTLLFRVGAADSPSCPGLHRQKALVALLDGKQVPVGDLGSTLRFAFEGTETTEFMTTLRALRDGTPHGLSFVVLTDAQYSQAPLDGIRSSPWWEVPEVIGWTMWN